MPTIKANVVPNSKRKIRDFDLSSFQSSAKREDLQVEVSKAVRPIVQQLRSDLKADIQGLLQFFGNLSKDNYTLQPAHPPHVPAGFHAPAKNFVPPRVDFPSDDEDIAFQKAFEPVGPLNMSKPKEAWTPDAGGQRQEGRMSSKGSEGSTDEPLQPRVRYVDDENNSNSPHSSSIEQRNSLSSKMLQRKKTGVLEKRDFAAEAPNMLSENLVEEESRLQRVVHSDYFDYLMGFIVFVNAVTLGAQTEYQSSAEPGSGKTVFQAINLSFCGVFSIELALRLSAAGSKFLTMSGWQWNLFDSLVVVFSLVDELTTLAFSGTDVQNTIDSIGFLRVLRLGRIMRLVRLVRLIPALKSMVYLMISSMTSFLWTVVLIFILMYCVAVYFVEISTDYRVQKKNISEIAPYWGSMTQAVSTLFQAITGGDDWHNFVQVFKSIDESTYVQNMVIFILYIAFASLVMMNLVTGVFVEGAQRIAQEEKNQELKRHVRRILQNTKMDLLSLISEAEFVENLASREMEDYLQAFGMDISHAKDVFYMIDVNQTGSISMRDFFAACIQLQGTVRLADTEILRHRLMHSFEEVHGRLSDLEELIRSSERKSGPATQEASFARTVDFLPPMGANLSGYILKGTAINSHVVKWL